MFNAGQVRGHWRPLSSRKSALLQKVINDPSTVGSRIFVLEDGISTHLPKIRYDMGSQDFGKVSTAAQNTARGQLATNTFAKF